MWEWFWDLQPGFNYTELYHWSNMTKNKLAVWEVDLLNKINHEYFGVLNE